MTHGHELKVGAFWWVEVYRWERKKEKKKWDNYNSTTKIILKKRHRKYEKKLIFYSNKKNKVPWSKLNKGGKRPVLRKLYNTEERN